jgi:hypothetical protein
MTPDPAGFALTQAIERRDWDLAAHLAILVALLRLHCLPPDAVEELLALISRPDDAPAHLPSRRRRGRRHA